MARLTVFAKANGDIVATGINEFIFTALKGTTQKLNKGTLEATINGTFSTVGIVQSNPANTLTITTAKGTATGTTKVTATTDTNMYLPTTDVSTVYFLSTTVPTVPYAYGPTPEPVGTLIEDHTADIAASVGNYIVAYKTTIPSQGAIPTEDTVLISMGYKQLTSADIQ